MFSYGGEKGKIRANKNDNKTILWCGGGLKALHATENVKYVKESRAGEQTSVPVRMNWTYRWFDLI